MVTSISIYRCPFCWPAIALLGLAAPVALAGPGFIAGTRIVGDSSAATIEVRFNCKAVYLRHEPEGGGDRLRIYVEPSGICNGVSPSVALSRTRLRPANSDSALLADLEYDGESSAGPMLTFNFTQPVAFDVDMSGITFDLAVTVSPASDANQTLARTPTTPRVSRRPAPSPNPADVEYVINLASLTRVPTIEDAAGLALDPDQRLYYSEVMVNSKAWYRLRLGNFESSAAAAAALGDLKERFAGAWVDRFDAGAEVIELQSIPAAKAVDPTDDGALPELSKIDALMEEARKLMASGDISRAVQIYTKVLQQPENSRSAEAQEFLALAREKNGQVAHAKAEYRRYMALYPNGDGAARVDQRLAALLATDQRSRQNETTQNSANAPDKKRSDWRVQTYFSQYYRRDANQQSDRNEIVSQSALYSDINFDARRRGARFDFSSRLSAGYRNDFLDEDAGSGSSSRISYAFADIADTATGLRGRIGRQSRTNGGVLGRFDGFNLGYQLNDRVLLNTVYGRPAYSSSDGIDSSRSFYGASVNYGPVLENLELGLFYIAQDTDGIDDREAVGGDFRYFGSRQSFWGMVDYDLGYDELASAFLQGSWRFDSQLSLHGLVDRRGSPFLSAGNALIGQPVLSIAELAEIYGEDELRQLGRDRTSFTTTYTLGISYPLGTKLQVNVDASRSAMDATPASGGVAATDQTTYDYYSASMVASSLLREGDVSIVTARWSDSGTARVTSLTFDSRYPIGRTWRINPRLRVDRRQRIGNPNDEWIYTPGIRVQYRRSQKFRLELETGKTFVQRDSGIADLNLDRESYFINVGYQSFF